MEVTDSACVELAAQFGRDRGRDQLAGGWQVVETLEQIVQPVRDSGAARFGEAPRLGDIRNGEDAGNDLDADAGRGRIVAKAQEAVGGEEELSDGAVRAGVDLALEIVEIGGLVGRVRVAFRIGCDRDVEGRDCFSPSTSSAAFA